MKSAKQEVLEVLDALPDDAPMETVLERVRFKAKILHSQAQADRGEGVPHEQVVERLDQWLQSLGHPTLSPTSKQ
jgi:predicted transcriptional regulator